MISQRDAELFAAHVLEWICADSARLAGFMGATGATPASLRQNAAEPGFLMAVLDFLMADETQLIACCAALEVPAELPGEARAALPGGDQWHWT